MTQPDLLTWSPPATDRHGETYDHERDFERLSDQCKDVWKVLRDGEWHTLRGIAIKTDHPEASISARIRDIRAWLEEKGHTVKGEYVKRGLWRYRVTEKI